MRMLITGAQGQLGWELSRVLSERGEVLALDRQALDLAQPDALRSTLRELRPEVILNAGAYTAVDKAETEAALAHSVNGVAPGILAEEAKRTGALLLHYSTDYVFDGNKRTPYVESDATAPLNAYGKSKLAGEQAILATGAAALILRTSWVYANRGKNFLLTMRRLAQERDEISVVADQIGVPNWAHRLALATGQLLALGVGRLAENHGIYHLSAGGSASWYEFARAIIGDVARPRVVPITSQEYPLPAPRPAYGVMSNGRIREVFGLDLPDWRSDLKSCLALV